MKDPQAGFADGGLPRPEQGAGDLPERMHQGAGDLPVRIHQRAGDLPGWRQQMAEDLPEQARQRPVREAQDLLPMQTAVSGAPARLRICGQTALQSGEKGAGTAQQTWPA